jgi:predicted RNase H-like nuclease (RuvC/YqgF family)
MNELIDAANDTLDELKTPRLARDIRTVLEPLFRRVNRPEDFVPESVSDAKHDLEYLFRAHERLGFEIDANKRLVKEIESLEGEIEDLGSALEEAERKIEKLEPYVN